MFEQYKEGLLTDAEFISRMRGQLGLSAAIIGCAVYGKDLKTIEEQLTLLRGIQTELARYERCLREPRPAQRSALDAYPLMYEELHEEALLND